MRSMPGATRRSRAAARPCAAARALRPIGTSTLESTGMLCSRARRSASRTLRIRALGLAPVIEDVGAPRQRPADVERMPQLDAHPHPSDRRWPRRGRDSRASRSPATRRQPTAVLHVVARELHPAPGVPGSYSARARVALVQRFLQLAEIEMRGHAARGARGSACRCRRFAALVQQALSPLRRLCDAALRDRVDPHAPEPDQQALRVPAFGPSQAGASPRRSRRPRAPPSRATEDAPSAAARAATARGCRAPPTAAVARRAPVPFQGRRRLPAARPAPAPTRRLCATAGSPQSRWPASVW